MDISTRYTYFTGILMYKFTSGLLTPSNDFHFVKNIRPLMNSASIIILCFSVALIGNL